MSETSPEFNAYRSNIINGLVQDFHGENIDRGWWKDSATGESIHPIDLAQNGRAWAIPYVIATKVALVGSENSEALEGFRTDAMDDKLPHRLAIEVEFADEIIRILDISGALGLDLGGAIMEKRAYNMARKDHNLDERAKVGGKKF